MEFLGTALMKGHDTVGKATWSSHEGNSPGHPRTSGQGGASVPLAAAVVANMSKGSRSEEDKRERERKREKLLRKMVLIGKDGEAEDNVESVVLEEKEHALHGRP